MERFFDNFELTKRNKDVEDLEKKVGNKPESYSGFIDTKEIDKKIKEKNEEMEKKDKEIKVIEELLLNEKIPSDNDIHKKLDFELKILYNELRLLDDERKKLEAEKDSLIKKN